MVTRLANSFAVCSRLIAGVGSPENEMHRRSSCVQSVVLRTSSEHDRCVRALRLDASGAAAALSERGMVMVQTSSSSEGTLRHCPGPRAPGGLNVRSLVSVVSHRSLWRRARCNPSRARLLPHGSMRSSGSPASCHHRRRASIERCACGLSSFGSEFGTRSHGVLPRRPNNRLEFVRCAHPTRKQLRRLLAAQPGR